jgi:GLPGLI family protein
MKKTVCLLLTVACCSFLNAQKDSSLVVAHYTLKHIMDTTQPENPVTNRMALYLGNNLSWYTYERTASVTSLGPVAVRNVPAGTISAGTVSAGASLPTNIPSNFVYNNSYIKDRDASQLIYLTMPVPGDKLFAVSENLPAINWSIASDTKEIQGISCQKATGRFKGRDYTVWFSSQIPYSNGPWKLGGLPGLILEAYDTNKEVVFTLTELETSPAKPTLFEISATAVKTNPKEYVKFKEAMEKDRNASRGASSAGGMIVVSGVAISSDGKPLMPRQNNNPIEKPEN